MLFGTCEPECRRPTDVLRHLQAPFRPRPLVQLSTMIYCEPELHLILTPF